MRSNDPSDRRFRGVRAARSLVRFRNVFHGVFTVETRFLGVRSPERRFIVCKPAMGERLTYVRGIERPRFRGRDYETVSQRRIAGVDDRTNRENRMYIGGSLGGGRKRRRDAIDAVGAFGTPTDESDLVLGQGHPAGGQRGREAVGADRRADRETWRWRIPASPGAGGGQVVREFRRGRGIGGDEPDRDAERFGCSDPVTRSTHARSAVERGGIAGRSRRYSPMGTPLNTISAITQYAT